MSKSAGPSRIGFVSLAAAVMGAVGCAERTPFVVLTVEDPLAVGTGFATLYVGFEQGELQPVKVRKSTFPLGVTVTAAKAGPHELWVEARDAGGTALGRGNTEARLRSDGTPTANIQLAKACDTDPDCSDSLFCTGSETCGDGMCASAGNPCAANVECAQSTCVELGMGDGRCDVTVNHLLCGTGSYCNPTRGCVEGQGCTETSDCSDGYECNGEEQCINLVCAPGLPPAVNDGDICTLDGCDDARTGGGEEAVFHVALASLDGSACTIPNTGPPLTPGVCVSNKEGCAVSECGDGVTDLATEECDDGNAVETDQCLSTCETARCGDGQVFTNSTEVCDDGNEQSGDGCRNDCKKVEVCGDRELDAHEDCDDGNQNPEDGCDQCQGTTWRASAVVGGVGLATAVGLNSPFGIATDRDGCLYVADTYNNKVRRITAEGVVTTVAGTGASGTSGDGGPATSARLMQPQGVAVDGLGNIFIADTSGNRVRRVTPAGIIDTIAGVSLMGGFSGDGGQAGSAELHDPAGVAIDGLGNLLIADTDNNRVRKVDTAGVITTIVGGGSGGLGDGGLATAAQLSAPTGIAIDRQGNLLIADRYHHRIRKVTPAGLISTIAGTGAQGNLGDGGPATNAELSHPCAVAADEEDNVYIAEYWANRVRKVTAAGTISTLAGTGTAGFSGDGGAATTAMLYHAAGVAVGHHMEVFITDSVNNRIRVVSPAGVIRTLVGTGAQGFIGDGGAATSAPLGMPHGVAVDGLGGLFIADTSNNRVRRVSPNGVITTVVGNGTGGYSGDGGPALRASLSGPTSVALDSDGSLLVADTWNHRVRRVDAAGVITTVAGKGTAGFSGDGDQAVLAQLSSPFGVAVGPEGDIFIADLDNHRVRRVDPDGLISTAAGSDDEGYGGDGGDATKAMLNWPLGVAVDSDNTLYIADSENHRIRRVTRAGIIDTFAGSDSGGYAGDGGPAVGAALSGPRGVAVDGLGNVLIADVYNAAIRRVSPDGVIQTLAGTNVVEISGDGGPATSTALGRPYGVAADPLGVAYIADAQDHRVRRVSVSSVITTVAGRVDPEGMGPASQARLADPRAFVRGPDGWLFAGGSSGTVQYLREPAGWLEVVCGRYPQNTATAPLARFRDLMFGDVGGVAFDATAGLLYFTETSFNRLHAVTIVDPSDEDTWTIAPLAGDAAAGTAGFADAAAASALFREPTGLFVDAAARVLYVADTGNHVIRALDLATGEVSTPIGTGATLGFFGDEGLASEALLFAPEAVTRCPNGDVFVADTGNNRVRRVHRVGADDLITTVLGDGTGASSGEGFPAWTFPVEEPRGLMCDSFGNLYVTSTSTVRMLPATDAGIVDGEGPVQTIYGGPPRSDYPASISFCLTGLFVDGEDHVFVTDACEGLFVELWCEP